MSAPVDVRCPQCGYVHPERADALACNAIHGRPIAWPGVRDPLLVCLLCGAEGRASWLLRSGGHFHVHHGRAAIVTGHLVAPVADAPDLSAYTEPS